ncbi:hypothetical protein MMC08_008254 [Hypocenomyce scalaris]|nr:hypothetical protein [Hypocenomyce scalaris]
MPPSHRKRSSNISTGAFYGFIGAIVFLALTSLTFLIFYLRQRREQVGLERRSSNSTRLLTLINSTPQPLASNAPATPHNPPSRPAQSPSRASCPPPHPPTTTAKATKTATSFAVSKFNLPNHDHPPIIPAKDKLTPSERHARLARLAALDEIPPSHHAHLHPPTDHLFDSGTTDTSEMDLERRGPPVNAAYARYQRLGERGWDGGGVSEILLQSEASEGGDDWRVLPDGGEGRDRSAGGMQVGRVGVGGGVDAGSDGGRVGRGAEEGKSEGVEVPRPLNVRKPGGVQLRPDTPERWRGGR